VTPALPKIPLPPSPPAVAETAIRIATEPVNIGLNILQFVGNGLANAVNELRSLPGKQ